MIPGLLGSLSGGFRPTDIDGCVLWLDAAQLGLSDNAPVDTWINLVGNGNNAVQSTEGRRPVYSSTNQAVYFSGSVYLALSSRLTTVRTIVALDKWTIAQIAPPWFGDSSTYPFHGKTGTPLLDSQYSAESVRNGTMWINGVESVVGSGKNKWTDLQVTALVTTEAIALSLISSDREIAGREFNGYKREVAIYSSALSVEQIQTLTSYLGQRAGITLHQEPVNTVAPALSGTAQVGQSMSCDTGTWTNEPTTYTYQWWKELSPGSYSLITGATASSLLLTPDLETFSVQCRVAASNVFAGPNEAQSADSDAIIAA